MPCTQYYREGNILQKVLLPNEHQGTNASQGFCSGTEAMQKQMKQELL